MRRESAQKGVPEHHSAARPIAAQLRPAVLLHRLFAVANQRVQLLLLLTREGIVVDELLRLRLVVNDSSDGSGRW